MLRKLYHSKSDGELNVIMRMDNIKKHMKLLNDMIDELEKQITKRRYMSSEELLTPEEQELIFNGSCSLDFSNKSI